MKKVVKILLMCMFVCVSMCSCSDADIDNFFEEVEEDFEIIENTDDNSDIESDDDDSLFYSTNDYDTATKGNSGIFSYKSKGGSYDVYWIIDFDENYVYFFTDGNGESACDKLKLVSGTLNDLVTVSWGDAGGEWYLSFKYVNQPVTLKVTDHNGVQTEFGTTDLDNALEIRDSKEITTY